MTSEDELLFVIYNASRYRKDNKDVPLTEFLVPFEEIKKYFYNITAFDIEYIVSILLTKGLISGTEGRVSMNLCTEMFIPGDFGDAKVRLAPKGVDRVSEILNKVKDAFHEIYRLYKENNYRTVIVDMFTLHELEEKCLKDLEQIGYVNVLGRTGTVLGAAEGGFKEHSIELNKFKIDVTEIGLISAHEMFEK